MKALLNQARPRLEWEPTLIEVREHRVQVYTGLAMRLRMAVVLGWRRTYRVVRILREAGVGITGISVERRWFLKQAGLWTLGLTLSGLASLGLESTRLAAWASEKTRGLSDLNPALRKRVSHSAWILGIRSYDVSRNGDETLVKFSHIDPSKTGVLDIQWFDQTNKATFKLYRGSEVKILIWDGAKGTITFSDVKGRLARSTFSINDKAWVNEDFLSQQVFDENQDDIKLMGAIASDASVRNLNQQGSEPAPSAGVAAICCNYDIKIKEGCWMPSISEACQCAHANAASRCSNQYCWGCCDYLNPNCDCYCFYGDFWCFCAIIGYPCKSC